ARADRHLRSHLREGGNSAGHSGVDGDGNPGRGHACQWEPGGRTRRGDGFHGGAQRQRGSLRCPGAPHHRSGSQNRDRAASAGSRPSGIRRDFDRRIPEEHLPRSIGSARSSDSSHSAANRGAVKTTGPTMIGAESPSSDVESATLIGRNVSFRLAGQILSALINVGGMVLLGNFLGSSGYGNYAFYYALIPLIASMSDLG